MRTSRTRRLITQVVWLAFALMAIAFTVLRRPDGGDAEAWAAPPRGKAAAAAPGLAASAGPADAGAAPPPAAASAAPTADGDAGTGAIDLAIAPDGGVPFHPEGTAYRSPFAKPHAQPVRVKVGFLLNSIDDYDVKTGTFNADFFLSLTSPVPMPDLNPQSPNGKIDSKETLADKPTFKLFRFTGAFKSPPDLRKYPFDSQEVKIVLEEDTHGVDQVRFVVDHDRTQLARGFRVLGWQVSYAAARSLNQSYPDRFEGDDLYYGRYVFTLGIDRFATSAAFKVFVPAFVIVLISLLGMWVPPNEMEVRSNAGAPMLAGAVLFHFALMQELPATSYLTRADKLMMGVYLSLALGMISTWWMFLVEEDNMIKVFRVARIAVPILTVVVMAIACLA